MSSEDQARLKGKKRVAPTASGPDVKKPKPAKEGGDRFCWICHREPSSLWCDTCPRSYHASCVNLKVKSLTEWVCPECVRVMAAENVDTRSASLSLLTVDEFCSLLQFAIQRLKQHTHEAFLKPVCTKTYTSYTKYVSHPFDLSILEKNVRWKHYGCTEAFLSDARWIYHNCIIFNGYNHKLSMSAKVLMKVCKQEMEDIEVCPDCYKNANTQESWFTEPCRRPHLLVWAKLKGFPYWPAKAMRLQDGNIDARFFGAHDRAWVPMAQCFLLSKESPTDIKNRKKGLHNAVEELEIYIQKYRKKFGEYRYSALRTTLTAEDFQCSQASPPPVKHQQQDEQKEKESETSSKSPKTEDSELSSAPSLDPLEKNVQSDTTSSLKDKSMAGSTRDSQSDTPNSSKYKSVTSSASSTPTRADPRKETELITPLPSPRKETSLVKEEKGALVPLPDGAPQGIFEVSSELPGELQMKVSKEDMEDLPKMMNRKFESLVSALKKIERSISSDRSNSTPDAEDENSSDNRTVASAAGSIPKSGQSPSSCEVSSTTVTTDQGEVPSSQFAAKEPPSTEEQPLAPADDFQEKLKKTILSCKEKVGGTTTLLEEPADEEEEMDEEEEEVDDEEDEEEEGVAEEATVENEAVDTRQPKETRADGISSKQQQQAEKDAAVPENKHSPPEPPEAAAAEEGKSDVEDPEKPAPSADMVEDEEQLAKVSKPPGRAKMKFTTKRSELDPLSSQPPSSGTTTPTPVQPVNLDEVQRPCSAEPKGEDDPSTKLYSTRNEPLDHKFELLTKHSCAEDESALVKRQHEINQKLKEQLEQASVLVAALKHQLDDTKKGRADALKEESCTEKTSEIVQKAAESIERIRQECKEEMLEYHHILALTLKEMRICIDLEHKKTRASLIEKHAVDMAAAISETKRKQWCANCWKEAALYCCWNTCYCDYPCQQAHWPKHIASCTQANNSSQQNAGVILNNGPTIAELSLSAGKGATSMLVPTGGFPASTHTMGGLPFDPVE
nr:MYND-type zinc finger-containing chromatin reader ZMYND8-like isoform X2 [Dermacentor andersoni]XP_054922504.1 MYND-type zinc finger-containing chromatin reader ZMYND8-like isoform X2 [Dermacentor andersoni]